MFTFAKIYYILELIAFIISFHHFKALEKLNETEIDGKKLFVSKFEKKSERLSHLKRQYDERKLEKLKKYYGINLFVKNLDDRIDSERLKKDFSPFGKITSAKVIYRNLKKETKNWENGV